jgi:hypothetical protein
MAAATTRRKAATKPAPEPEVVEDEFEDMEDTEDEDVAAETGEDDLEELEDGDEVEADEKPKAKRKPPVQPKIEFGSPWLAAHVTEVTGDNYDSRAIRMLLRKLAKDGTLERTVGEDRGRYEFSGPKDPIVLAIVKMVKDGTAKALKQEGLQAVKDAAAKKRADAKAAKAAEAEGDDEDDMDEVEETPAPKRTVRKTTPTKTTAPAKATPATARRRAAAAK